MNTIRMFVTSVMFAAIVCAADDLQGLQGTWLTISQIHDGKTLLDENTPAKPGLPVVKLSYQGNKWLVLVGEKTVATGFIRVDATKSPKEIDILDETGEHNGKTRRAIYELDADTFRYCIALDGQPRPTVFASKAGTGHSLIVSKREK